MKHRLPPSKQLSFASYEFAQKKRSLGSAALGGFKSELQRPTFQWSGVDGWPPLARSLERTCKGEEKA